MDSERRMTYIEAILWSLVSTFLFVLLIGLQAVALKTASVRLLVGFACQVAAMLPGLLLMPRVYAPKVGLREVFAFRPVHPGFYALAVMLGLVVQVPANAFFQAIDRRYPSGLDLDKALLDDLHGGRVRQVALVLIIALLGPVLEELFYRGALFSPLRRRHASFGVILATSALFAVAHVEWRMFIPITIVGLALGVLRSASGSILPSAIMHCVFNGTTLVALFTGDAGLAASEAEASIPANMMIGGSLLTLIGLGLAYYLGQRSEAAASARRKDVS
jgi:CAAX protease family protein